jgi:hypothetical protein
VTLFEIVRRVKFGVVRRAGAFVLSALVGVSAASGIVACQLVDPGSTLDYAWKGDGGGARDGEFDDGPGVRCYADVVDDQAVFRYCPAGESCCYTGSFLGTGVCQGSPCGNLSFKCSDQAECPPKEICCAQSGLMGDYLVLQGSTCVDACPGAQPLVLCDLQQSGVCPPGKTCQTNGPNNRPLGYASCQ